MINNTIKKLNKALQGTSLSVEEGLFLYKNTPTSMLMWAANQIRKEKIPHGKVTWMIDRNVNITNVCISRCKFCNFHKKPGDAGTYITSLEEYDEKIMELFDRGGNQLLLQGGMHPDLGIDYYINLFKELKKRYPELKLHALGPPEIVHLAKMENLSYRQVLEELINAGLDSLPGAGAEILCDEIRKKISPAKATAEEWLNVMREAHRLYLTTTATMMFGHIETMQNRIEHLFKIREVQNEKPKNAVGFLAFIPWPFQDENTFLKTKKGIINKVKQEEYIRLIAMSRLILNNISNIQASWLTVGKETAQICLHAGANDFGSIMIEENVVSSAGARNSFDAKEIHMAIREAGFKPQLRDQQYRFITRK